MVPVTTLWSNIVLSFDHGRIDEYRVRVDHPDGFTHYPRDEMYFTMLRDQVDNPFNKHRIYGDFVKIYDMTGEMVEDTTLDLINSIAEEYPNPELMQFLFTILYLTMIAEENRQGTKLGRRIKRLGVRQVLIENRTPCDAACYSRGMIADDIVAECRKRGF